MSTDQMSSHHRASSIAQPGAANWGPQYAASLSSPIHESATSAATRAPPPQGDASSRNVDPNRRVASEPASRKGTKRGPTERQTCQSKRKVMRRGPSRAVRPSRLPLPHPPPGPGTVSDDNEFYSTKRNESLRVVANKLGLEDWKVLATVPENVEWYGQLRASTMFKENTIVRIPVGASPWMLSKLADTDGKEMVALGTCICCQREENPHDPNDPPLLLCDGCNAPCHLSCTGCTDIPEGDWLCGGCIDVLQARRAHYYKDLKGDSSLYSPEIVKLHRPVFRAVPPTNAGRPLPPETLATAQRAREEHLPRYLKEKQRLKTNASQEAERVAAELRDAIDEEDSHQIHITEEATSITMEYSHVGVSKTLLGFLKVRDETEVQVLNLLCEPDELILVVPIDTEGQPWSIDIHPNRDYAIFATQLLFCPYREDSLPMDLSSLTSVRLLQRRLMELLKQDDRNLPGLVAEPRVPSSVHLRGSAASGHADHLCFELANLVRDCNCPLDKPRAEIPKRLADHGLVLRDYQKSSLQWMLDKERNATGMGSFAGELWTHYQALDGSCSYFYCELTGSFSKNIFDYIKDVDQKDASMHYGSLPSGGILADEMGLGKTVICISLIAANPPSSHNRVLPREFEAPLTHFDYFPPPCVVGCTSSTSKKKYLSNGTLVVAPMTLCSQWQKEIEKFAPWMKVVTIHTGEYHEVQDLASADIVVCSTFVVTNLRQSSLLKLLRRIHFHRIILDESHYNQTGQRAKLSLASLSSTFRYCVTGTPVGHSLADLYGQLRFLRVPLFCRENFWSQNIGTPYYDRNEDSLRVLRSLLSRIVVRHAKEQCQGNGEAMLLLPPRTVETLLLPFSELEQKVYDTIESRNKTRFLTLQSEAPQAVLGQYMELTSMCVSLRQSCGHVSLVDLYKLQETNQHLESLKAWGSSRIERNESSEDKATTRAAILQLAMEKGRPSALRRLREGILEFQGGVVHFMECPICLDPIGEADVAFTPCGHKFCGGCIANVILDGASTSREPTGRCPQCRDKFRRSELIFLGDANEAGIFDIVEEDRHHVDKNPAAKNPAAVDVDTEVNGFHFTAKDIILESVTSSSTPRISHSPLSTTAQRTLRSDCYLLKHDFLDAHISASGMIGTKISCLVEEIRMMMTRDASSKGVVFSQFLGSLDIAAAELRSRGVKFVRVDGNMKQHQRADALVDFESDPQVRVFLLSMRAGASGLNLVAADHCFILDPPQNSAMEEQAIDRVHRIGQERPVTVKRFIIQGTVEERILSARRAVGADAASGSANAGALAAQVAVSFSADEKFRLDADDEKGLQGQRLRRLHWLENLFGCSEVAKICKA